MSGRKYLSFFRYNILHWISQAKCLSILTDKADKHAKKTELFAVKRANLGSRLVPSDNDSKYNSPWGPFQSNGSKSPPAHAMNCLPLWQRCNGCSPHQQFSSEVFTLLEDRLLRNNRSKGRPGMDQFCSGNVPFASQLPKLVSFF